MADNIYININPSNREICYDNKQLSYNNNANGYWIQEELIKMGFDLTMINKVLFHYNITSVGEGISNLVKTNGMWDHSFIPQVKNKNQEVHEKIVSSALKEVRKKINIELCEICGESKSLHRVISQNSEEVKEKESQLLVQRGTETNEMIIKCNNDNQCGICMDYYVNPVALPQCKHQFCFECINEYIIYKIVINDIDKINCPNADCLSQLTDDYIQKDLSQEMKDKYNRYKLMNQIANDPNKVFCPLCDSFGQLEPSSPQTIFDPQTQKKDKLTLKCLLNDHTFCSCGRTEHEGECYQESKELKRLIIKEHIKKCPKCGFLIKKSDGCNHMICGNSNCKYDFCWLCMQECAPNHYLKGKCNGMQFINERGFLYKMRKCPCLLMFFESLFKCLFVFALIVIALILILCPVFSAIVAIIFKYREEGLHDDRIFSILFVATQILLSIAFIPLYYVFLSLCCIVIILYCIVILICLVICAIDKCCSH